MKKQLPGWAALLIITLIAGLALGCTYALTEKPIEQQTALTAEKARQAVLPSAESFVEIPLPETEETTPVQWCYEGKSPLGNGDMQPAGYVLQTTVQGFGGPLDVIIGFDVSLSITGISVGGSNFSETPGLGAKSKDPSFTDQFINKTAPLTVIKAGEEAGDDTIDAITAATITSRAVTSAVNYGAEYMKVLLSDSGEEVPPIDD